MSKQIKAGASAVVLVLVSLARGDIIAQYQFAGTPNTNESNPAFAPTIQMPNVAVSSIRDPRGTVGLEISNAPGGDPPMTYSTAPFLRLDPQGGSVDAAAAVANNKYFEFTLTPRFELDLESLTFNVARGGGSTPRGVVVRSSIDNFAADLFSADIATARPTFTPVNIDLSGPAYQNLMDPITFRIYSYSTGAGASLDYDDITVNGVIPEPASVALAMCACLVLARRRR
jgi:hypothetical protein